MIGPSLWRTPGSILILIFALAACTSPESTRTRGGGPGADTGNRGSVVVIHHGAKPFYNTPHVSPAAPAPADTAQHAHDLSAR